jgi:hypothetical protein
MFRHNEMRKKADSLRGSKRENAPAAVEGGTAEAGGRL